MRYAIPITGERISPRCIFAESLLLLNVNRNRLSEKQSVKMTSHGLLFLAKILSENRIDTLICGGISRDNKSYLNSRNIEIIDNVVATVDELIPALVKGNLQPGFGLDASSSYAPSSSDPSTSDIKTQGSNTPDTVPDIPTDSTVPTIDCIACRNRICLEGKNCLTEKIDYPSFENEDLKICEAAMDITCEDERTLCRLSELVYFCLEMKYRKIGVAYCIDLTEPAEILVRVLRRFFEVVPVCCKVGGQSISDPYSGDEVGEVPYQTGHIACNPLGQAAVLNRMHTDFNVLIGICMGADCVLTRYSEAPVTVLFVKDKSLANNPIGAVYSDYYLKEAASASVEKT